MEATGWSATKPRLGRSRSTAGSGYKGTIPEEVWDVLERAWSRPFSLSGDYSRYNAIAVGVAASLGWITNISLDGLSFSKAWHLTAEGATAYRMKEKLS